MGDLMMKREGMGLLQLLKLKKTNEHTHSVYAEFPTMKFSYIMTILVDLETLTILVLVLFCGTSC